MLLILEVIYLIRYVLPKLIMTFHFMLIRFVKREYVIPLLVYLIVTKLLNGKFDITKVVLSPERRVVVLVIYFFISLENITKKRDPKVEPCETLLIRWLSLDLIGKNPPIQKGYLESQYFLICATLQSWENYQSVKWLTDFFENYVAFWERIWNF